VARRSILVVCAVVVALFAGGAAVHTTATSASTPVATASGSSASAAASASASGSASPAPSLRHPSAAVLRKVDTIELGAEAIALRHDGTLVAEGSLRSGRSAVKLMTRLLGTPQRAQTAVGDGGACLPANSSYTWGGTLRLSVLAKRASAGNDLVVRILGDSVQSKGGATVLLQGPDGVGIGDDIAARIAAADPDDVEQLGAGGDAAWQLLLRQGWGPGGDGGTNGVSAMTDGDHVTVIGAPMPVHATTQC
jgi:hypothetical protein